MGVYTAPDLHPNLNRGSCISTRPPSKAAERPWGGNLFIRLVNGQLISVWHRGSQPNDLDVGETQTRTTRKNVFIRIIKEENNVC